MIGRTNGIWLGTDTTDATATADKIVYGKIGYADGERLVGEGAYWQNVTNFYRMFVLGGLPEYFEVNAPLATGSMRETFMDNPNVVHLKLTVGDGITSFQNTFRGMNNLSIIEGELNLSNNTITTTMFIYDSALTEVRFTKDTMKLGISFSNSPLLSTASLLSIANGLNAESALQTLTMHTTSKTTMNNIMVDNNAGLAAIGTAMTLTAFITSVKGWTIA